MTARAAKSTPAKQPEPEINVTPLVDVVLVLLIIFMVIAPNLQEGTPVALPEVGTPDEKKLEDAIEVVMDRDAKLHYESEPVERGQLFATIERLRAEKPSRPIVLKADAALPYGLVRELFSDLQREGLTNVALKVVSHEAKEG